MSDEQGPPVTIQRLANAVYAPLAMKAGMQLDLFTPLKDGPMTAAELAASIGIAGERLELLLFALVAAGLLTEEDDRFANTPEADRYLVRGRATYMGNSHLLYSELWGAAMLTGDSLLAGAPRARHDFAGMGEDELSGFYRGTHGGALGAGRRLAELVDLSASRRLIDVGGGSGGVAIALCETFPELRATVAELPSVIPITRSIVAESGVADRVDVTAVDIVAGKPEGEYDTAVMRNLVQVLSAADAGDMIRHVGEAVAPGGTAHVLGWIVDDSRDAPLEAAVHNLVFINFYDDGRAYTEREHRDWFAAAGFVDIERRVLLGGYGVISGRKA